MKTIIVFEEEQAISNIFRVGLERLGYTVLQAATRKEATAPAEQYQPPIHPLIADMRVRVFACIRVAKAVTSSHPHMAVLFISGLPPAELTQRRLMDSDVLGFPHVDFLQTPFMPWLLQQHVRELIGPP